MTYPPELDLIDQLLGTDMPLSQVTRIFSEETQLRRVLAAYTSNGVIVLSNDDGVLPVWKSQEILRDPRPLDEYENLRVALTEKGAKAFDSGKWQELR